MPVSDRAHDLLMASRFVDININLFYYFIGLIFYALRTNRSQAFAKQCYGRAVNNKCAAVMSDIV